MCISHHTHNLFEAHAFHSGKEVGSAYSKLEYRDFEHAGIPICDP